MLLDVAFLPADVRHPERRVCIVIDALRASSTIATLFARGVAGVVVAGTVDEARALHARLPGALLCGESGGLPPPGFDHGNSPAEFERLELSGRTVVLATSNGTRALALLAGARAVYVGSLLNLSACTHAALETAETSDGIAVVCAGNELGRSFSLEDTVVAGAFVERISGIAGSGDGAQLSDAATAALRLWRSYADEPRAAFHDAVHGRALVRLGLGPDLDACAQVDRYEVAPRLHVENERLILRWDATRLTPGDLLR